MDNKMQVVKKKTIFFWGEPVSDFWFDEIVEVGNFIVAYPAKDFLLILDSEGKVMLEEKVTVVDIDDLFIIVEKDGLKGVYFCNGQLILPIEHECIALYQDEIATLKNNNQISYTYSGEIIPQDQIINKFCKQDSY